MKLHRGGYLLVAGCFLGLAVSSSADGPRYADPKKVDADFAFQGEYCGQVGQGNDVLKLGVQVVALGKGNFRAVAYFGGLPGAGWNKEAPIRVDGKLADGAVKFSGDNGGGVLKDRVLTVIDANGQTIGKLEQTLRQSPTLGQKPPAKAVVLFDGTRASLDNWRDGRITEDGLLMEGTTSKRTFRDHSIHFEFRLAYQPEDRGQGRSNSGIYAQGRYEVQILDSFGLEPKDNECGGIYSVGAPAVNMCLPPLSWQTYDIDFTAAKYDSAGKIASKPRISVKHNGVLIHDNVDLPGDRSTTAAPIGPGPEPGPIYLQNHGCPLRYRNIWVVEK